MGKTIEFCYDIQCPYAYMASREIEPIVARNNATIIWKPVLLGGLYRNTQAPQGKDGSASDIMSSAKRNYSKKLLLMDSAHINCVMNMHPSHPVRSVKCMRLLVLASDEVRPALSHALYFAYFGLSEDINDIQVLTKYAKKFGIDIEGINSQHVKDTLRENTKSASDRGAFGVPAMFIDGKLFWGADRLELVDRALGMSPRMSRQIMQPLPTKQKKMQFFFDLSSPWAFLGATQLHQISQYAEVEIIPILLGALFKAIGTPNIPLLAMSPAKQKYMTKDLSDYSSLHDEPVVWPSVFPIRTVTPLRVVIAEPKTLMPLERAAWQKNQNIGDPKVLKAVLTEAGFDAESLIAKAGQDDIKATLRRNTEYAVKCGVVGVPAYKVDDFVVWGQDRMFLVQDLCNGWIPEHISVQKSKL